MAVEFENIRKHLSNSLSGISAVDHAEAKDREIREKLRKLHIGALAEFKGNTAQADASGQWYENYEQAITLRKLRDDVKSLRAELMESKFLTQALNNQLQEFRMTGQQVHRTMAMG